MSPVNSSVNNRRIKVALLAACGLLILVHAFQFWQTWAFRQTAMALRHELEQMAVKNAMLEGEVLKLRYGHVTHYDRLNALAASLYASLLRIETLSTPPLDVQALRHSLQDVIDQIDRFRRSNTVVHNSQRYLATLSEAAIKQTYPALHADLYALQRQFLYLEQLHPSEVQAGSPPPLWLESLRDASLSQPVLQPLLLHAQMLIREQTSLDRLTRTISANVMGTHLVGLERTLADEVRRHQQRTDTQVGFLTAGMVALLVMLFLLTRLYRRDLRLNSLVFETSPAGILITDRRARILRANPAVSTVSGYTEAELLGHTPALLKSDRQDKTFYTTLWQKLEADGFWQGELINRRKNGELYPEWLSIRAVRNERGQATHYVGVFTDLSEIRNAQERAERLAYQDTLTGLPNRALLKDRAEQVLAEAGREGRKAALMFIDLDNFKTINDSLGHGAGDQLLCDVSDRIQSCLRATDTLARYGGDEFILIPRSTESTEAIQGLVEKIHDCLQAPFLIHGHALAVTCSTGIAIYPDDASDFDNLMQCADTALYQAKADGRDGWRFFEETMNRNARENLMLNTLLHQALGREEISLVWQPRVDMRTGTLIGAEVLMRWHNTEHGAIPPSRFIPVAEASGFILQLGAWALRESCRQAQHWRDAGHPDFVLAVNISAVQFTRSDIAGEIAKALETSGLPARCLEIELTESVLVTDVTRTIDTLRSIKQLGISVAVDDFGTGYSSLSYLKRFDVDILKIDQSFVRDLDTDPDDAAIVMAIYRLANTLGLGVIAEGVEEESQRNFLLEIGCKQAQGYLFGRPMAPEAFENWMTGLAQRSR